MFNVNGASFNINNTKIDGAQSINVWLPHESAYVPTLEAIETVNVVSGSFDAETGLAGVASAKMGTYTTGRSASASGRNCGSVGTTPTIVSQGAGAPGGPELVSRIR